MWEDTSYVTGPTKNKNSTLTTEQPKLSHSVLYPVVLASCQALSSIFVSYVKRIRFSIQ